MEQNGEGGGKRLKTQGTFNAEKISEAQIGGIAVLKMTGLSVSSS